MSVKKTDEEKVLDHIKRQKTASNSGRSSSNIGMIWHGFYYLDVRFCFDDYRWGPTR